MFRRTLLCSIIIVIITMIICSCTRIELVENGSEQALPPAADNYDLPPEDSEADDPFADYEYIIEPSIENLPGMWQANPIFGRGPWLSRYSFWEDKSFIFTNDEWNRESRVVELYGLWELDGDNLILTVHDKIIVVGGEIEYHENGWQTIPDGEPELITLEEPEIIEYKLSKIALDPNFEILTIMIGGQQYWYQN